MQIRNINPQEIKIEANYDQELLEGLQTAYETLKSKDANLALFLGTKQQKIMYGSSIIHSFFDRNTKIDTNLADGTILGIDVYFVNNRNCALMTNNIDVVEKLVKLGNRLSPDKIHINPTEHFWNC